jgi:UPF0271 protein
MKRVLILDASALLAGFHPPGGDIECYTVPGVLSEIREETVRMRVEMEISSEELRLREPSPPALLRVEGEAASTGHTDLLSSTDRELLALALTLQEEGEEPQIVTDDYGIQNMARTLSIPFVPMAEMGIRRVLRWKTICKGCGKGFSRGSPGETCDRCGSPLKRVVRRSRRPRRRDAERSGSDRPGP